MIDEANPYGARTISGADDGSQGKAEHDYYSCGPDTIAASMEHLSLRPSHQRAPSTSHCPAPDHEGAMT